MVVFDGVALIVPDWHGDESTGSTLRKLKQSIESSCELDTI